MICYVRRFISFFIVYRISCAAFMPYVTSCAVGVSSMLGCLATIHDEILSHSYRTRFMSQPSGTESIIFLMLWMCGMFKNDGCLYGRLNRLL